MIWINSILLKRHVFVKFSVVGNGVTWGRIEPRTKIQEKKTKNFEF